MRRGDLLHAVGAEAHQILRIALVDHQPEVADRTLPVCAGGQHVAEPDLGAHQVLLPRHHRVVAAQEGVVDAVLVTADADLGGELRVLAELGVEQTADRTAGERLVAVGDLHRAAGGEDLGAGDRGLGRPMGGPQGLLAVAARLLDQPLGDQRLTRVGGETIDRRIEALVDRRRLEPQGGETVGDVGALEDRALDEDERHGRAVDGGVEGEVLRIVGDRHLDAVLDVGQREGDQGFDVGGRGVEEDVVDAHLRLGEEEVLALHDDRVGLGQRQTADGSFRHAVVGAGGRDAGRGEGGGQQNGIEAQGHDGSLPGRPSFILPDGGGRRSHFPPAGDRGARSPPRSNGRDALRPSGVCGRDRPEVDAQSGQIPEN